MYSHACTVSVCMHESLAPSATPDGIFWISSSVSASPLILIPLYLVCVCVCLRLHSVFVMLGCNRQNFNYCAKLADAFPFSACR